MKPDDEHDTDPADERLDSLLSDASVWEEPDPALEDLIVAAIAQEAAADTAPPMADELRPARDDHPADAEVVDLASRRWMRPMLVGVAAAAVLIVGFLVVTRDTGRADIEVAMAGTDLAPGAAADLSIDTTPNGTRLVLDVTGLPPAPEGQVYEAWLRQDAEVGVSAGTFHMRGGDGDLELWAGVTIEDYPLVTVTIQDEADTESSGQVVLKALVEED